MEGRALMHLSACEAAAYRPRVPNKQKVVRVNSLWSSSRGVLAMLILAAIIAILMFQSLGA
jgi:hypothetical protein